MPTQCVAARAQRGCAAYSTLERASRRSSDVCALRARSAAREDRLTARNPRDDAPSEAPAPASGEGAPPSTTYTTPTIPKSDHQVDLAPPQPPAAGPALFTPPDQHNIARAAPLILSKNVAEQNPSQAAGALITLLSTNASGSLHLYPTTPEERVLIVRLLREVGTPAYLKAFSHDIRGREILATWLSDATPPRKADVVDESEKWKDVLCPLLELLLELPISLEHLKDHVGLGKLITGAQKRARSEQARKLADAVKDRWSALVPARSSSGEARDSPPVAPKRPASSTASESVKRARNTTPPAVSAPARPAQVVSTRAANDRRASPQPNDLRIPTRSATAAARPSADPLATARRSMRGASAPTNANKDLAGFMSLIDQQPAPAPSAPAATSKEPHTERKKRKKSVHWKDYDGMPLVAVKMIEAAVYEDGDASVRGTGALDIEEGGVFRQAHAEMDEQIDWYTPRLMQFAAPESGPLPERGVDSEAKVAQEQREKTLPLASYASPHEIPDSPAEPDEFVLSFAAMMPPPKTMRTGLPGEVIEEAVDLPPIPPFPAMAAMMAQMAPSGTEGPSVPPVPPVPPFDPAMLQSLMQNSQSTGPSPKQDTPPPPPMPMPPWMGGGGMPFPFPFPPPPEVMAQMGGGGVKSPNPHTDRHDRGSAPPRSSRKGRR